jgi:hypothetical protein
MKTLLAVAATGFGMACSLTVRATDLSDLWWNANENGWGVNVAQQGSVLFLTFFLYGADRQPYWVSGSSTTFQGTNAAGGLVYSGPLAQTSGPWFGAPFSASSVIPNAVGTVTFTANSVSTATVSYNVGGTVVTKDVTRLTFRSNPGINGSYYGGVVGDTTGCALPSSNGHFEGAALVGVSGSTSSTQITIENNNGVCTISGAYTQAGRMGRVLGNIFCSSGASASVDVFEVEATGSGIGARYQANYSNGCREVGHFAGARR